MDFYLILQEIMEEQNINIPTVARRCGLSDGTVRSIIARKQKNVALEVAFKLSDGLNVSLERLNGLPEKQKSESTKKSPSDLSEEARKIARSYDKLDDRGKGAVRVILNYEKDAPLGTKADKPKVIPLPRIRRSQGFTEMDVFDEPSAAGLGNPVDLPPSHKEQYPSDYVPPKTNFGVLISGNSMEPKIPDGSTVFVQATPVLDNGEIGIFIFDGKSYCKQLKKDDETQQVALHSINPQYEDIVIPPFSELRVLGRVLGGYDPGTRDLIL